MAVSNFKFTTGANFAEGAQILSPLIEEIASQREAQVGMVDQMAELGFVEFNVRKPRKEITSIIGTTASQPVAEDEALKIKAIEQGYSKSYDLQEYGNVHRCSNVFWKWIEAGATDAGMTSDVQDELDQLKEYIEGLVDGDTLRQNIEMAQVYAKGGLATSAFGPGSPAGDGKALFATDHIVKSTGATYSNRMASGKLLTATTLQEAIDKFKKDIKMDNGYSVKTAKIYTLYVSRALETAARVILNTAGSQAGVYSGLLNNANQLNVFSFQGNMVELVTIDMLGEPDGSGVSGAVVGGDATTAAKMWFLVNKEELMKYKGLRKIKLPNWSREIRMWEENNPHAYYVSVDNYFSFDHFGAYPFMVGYLGD